MTTNFYPIKCNPCAMCVADKKKSETNQVKREDLIDFTLEGNNITLAVKEKSTTKLKTHEVIRGDEESKKPLSTPPTGPSETVNILPGTEQSPTFITSKENWIHEYNKVGGGFNNQIMAQNINYVVTDLFTDDRYFEEKIRERRLEQYFRDVHEGARKRMLWKSFQKDIASERKRNLIKSSGPAWWQEPSRKQICLAMSLEGVITADHEEAVTGRTRQWLLDLGVTTRLTPKQVRGCMRRSLLDPIDFLLETHSVILKMQLNVKKKTGSLEKPFSINERLLLSAICVLHLPTLLIMLHYMLPPPKPFSSSKQINELLFGDLNDDRIRYDSPYMEPLPFRSGKHFHDWAFDKVFRALFPAIYKGFQKDFGTKIKQPKTMALAKKSIMSFASQQMKNKICTLTNYDNTSMTPSITWLITKSVANRGISQSMKPYDDEVSDRPRFYSRRLTRKTIRDSRSSSNVPSIRETYNDNSVPLNYNNDVGNSPTHIDIKGTDMVEIEGGILKGSVHYSENGDLLSAEASRRIVRNSIKSDSSRLHHTKGVAYVDIREDADEPETPKVSVSKFDTVSIPSSSTVQETLNNFEEMPVPECKELIEIWNEIKDLPNKLILKHAIKVLADMGDPLAQLPQLHNIPAVQRWFEIRQGRHRILSKSTKADLLRTSRGMWKLAPASNSKEAPKIGCSKKVERLLTWDKKKWLEKQINNEMKNYFTRIKQEKVENSRYYFPSMLNHFDHGSKLNRNFRDVFFAYLPAREADTFVFRP